MPRKVKFTFTFELSGVAKDLSCDSRLVSV